MAPFTATVPARGTAPARAEVLSPMALTLTSVSTTFDTTQQVTPDAVSYSATNPVRRFDTTGEWLFASPAPQALTVPVMASGPVTVGATAYLRLRVTPRGPPRSRPPARSTRPRPWSSPSISLRMVPSRRSLSVRCPAGVRGYAELMLTGIAPTRVTRVNNPRSSPT